MAVTNGGKTPQAKSEGMKNRLAETNTFSGEVAAPEADRPHAEKLKEHNLGRKDEGRDSDVARPRPATAEVRAVVVIQGNADCERDICSSNRWGRWPRAIGFLSHTRFASNGRHGGHPRVKSLFS